MSTKRLQRFCSSVCCLLLALFVGNNVKAQNLKQARELGIKQSSLRNRAAMPVSAAAPKSDLDTFRSEIQPILQDACFDCHGPETQEGNMRIDTLNPSLLEGKDVDWWLDVQAVLTKGEMPPPDAGELSDEDRSKVIEWLANEIQVASFARRASGKHTSFRRMTRYEFNYALQDILGLPYDFAKDLPPEANSEDGFQNSSELLHMSVSQLETYRQSARRALQRATVGGERPEVVRWAVTMKDASRIDREKQQAEFEKEKAKVADNGGKLEQLEASLRKPHSVPYYKDLTNGRTARASWSYGRAKYAIAPLKKAFDVPESRKHVAILPRNPNAKLTIELGDRVPEEGIMRVRVRACRTSKNDEQTPSMQLWFGWQASNEGRALLRVSEQDTPIIASPDSPQFYQWDVPLGEIYPRNSVRKTSSLGSMPNPSEYIRLANSSVSQGDIQIDYVEVMAPVYDEWPPASHQRIFHDSKSRDNETVYAREVLSRFMSRVWRRDVNDEEIDGKLKLYDIMRPQCDNFEEAIVEVLSAVLASPQFLYLAQSQEADAANETLAAHELATRLSMFLWSSVPDAELSRLASEERLSDPEVLASQVTRLLDDPRSERFAQHFVHQWLDMQLLEFLSVDREHKSLKRSMQKEPVALFQQVLQTNANVLDFLHADYTMANERLAKYYDVPNVYGNHFRRIALAPDKKRGGLLTQAGLLAMNSAGKDSHPLKRGVWLLESLLNDPPPPPPPAVPEIDLADPEIAKLTLKEQIEDHRNHPACMSCHAKIDPWGIAFENYDAMGRWRTEIKGKPVDATSELFNHQQLDGMNGLKRFLLENRQDQFVRALVHKLATYALGRPMSFSDYAAIDEIAANARKQGDGLATMIKLIAASDLFQSR